MNSSPQGQRHRKNHFGRQEEGGDHLQLPRSATPTNKNGLHHRKRATNRQAIAHVIILVMLLCAAGPSLYFLHGICTDQRIESDALAPTSRQSFPVATIPQNRAYSLNQKQLYNVTIAKPENHLSPEKHQPIIPNIVTFTHYLNLIEVNFTREATLNKTFIADDELDELVVLQQNVRNIIALHPTAKVRFLTDDDCRRSIANVFEQIGKKRDTNATTTSSQLSLVDYFDKERAGMYKADLCRGAALWETGGLYFDVDLGVRMNVLTALQQTQKKRKQATTFCTVRVHEQSNRPGAFFQAFIGVTPQHAIIERYVELFWDYYRGMLPEYKNEPLGVVLLKQAMDDVLRHDPEAAATIELWQEVLYRTNMKSKLEKIVPYPPWGTRRACKFIVVSSAKNPFTVPFYSRIAGSRMCPVGSVTKVAAMKRHRKR